MKKFEEVMKIHMKKKEDCNRLEEEVVSLRVEVDKINKNLNSSLVLDKMCLGYTGAYLRKENTNSKPSKEETKK